LRPAVLAALSLLLLPACDAAKDAAKDALGTMEFSGTVVRAGTSDPIEGAQVNLIALANEDALKELVEYRDIPDGAGGQKKRLRIKIDQVAAYIAAHDDVVKAATDGGGKFKVEAPTNAYLVYTYGPGAAPGTSATSYGVHFWGIDPDTGELSLEHLIGKNLEKQQVNDGIQLSGGPVPPAPPAAATPQQPTPPAPPTPPAAPTDEQPEPVAGDELPPNNIIPPAASADWASIKLAYKDGFIGTGGELSAPDAPLPEGERFLELTAELSADQAEPVYLVIQKGFDSTYVADCGERVASATTRVYPVAVNGKTVSYQLVPPGPFYKLYLAKKAVQGADGEAPTDVQSASETLTVGKRTCDNAAPSRPFLATLSWDKQVDIDLHVDKFDAAKVEAATSDDEIGAAKVDQANWTRKVGETLSLDVDNVYGFGPENNGDAATVTSPDDYCYLVKLNYFSGSGDVAASVDVQYVATEDGKKVVRQQAAKVTMTSSGEWKTIGAFGKPVCSKLLSPLPSPENVILYPELSACVSPAACDLQGAEAGQHAATVTLEKTTFAASDTIKVTYDKMPGSSGDWITIVPATHPNNSWCSWQWSSGTTGTQYYGALPPGEYEVRMYYNWTGYSGSGGGQCEVIGKAKFKVE
jgi:hypothetical protein